MLFHVRNYLLLPALIIMASLLPSAARQASQGTAPPVPPQATQSQAPPVQQTPTAPPASISEPAAAPSGPIIVLDPAHGGTDTGARGANGAAEKDIVLQFSRTVRAELAHQNIRVVTTRDDDSNPSYDARAAIANGYRDAIFISIHVSSTGNAGTARAYYYRFSNTSGSASVAFNSSNELAPAPISFLPWAEAQKPFVDPSHRLADIIQHELGLRFSGSAAVSSGVAIRGLQSVTAPAVAIEISSISVPDPNSLLLLAGSLATAVSHAVLAFRPPGSPETRQ